MQLRNVLAATIACLAATGCSWTGAKTCSLPPLDEAEVVRVGRAFLDTKRIDASFRSAAQTRVSPSGCLYVYEEAEKLDSFGIGFVVELDRSGAVRDFYSSH